MRSNPEKVVRIEVHKNLQQVLEDLRKEIATDLKSHWGISEITIPRTLSSQILAARMQGKKILNYKVKRIGKDKGVLEFLY